MKRQKPHFVLLHKEGEKKVNRNTRLKRQRVEKKVLKVDDRRT